MVFGLKLMKIPAFTYLLFFLPLAMACEDDESGVGFEIASGFGQEHDGTQQIRIDLGKKVTSSVTISYIVGGSASLDGDYKILSNTNFSLSSMAMLVREGESTGVFSFQLIDDSQPEPRSEFIYIEITGISDPELNATLKNKQYTFEIEDNDMPPTDGLQVDLNWSVGEGVSINAANFDLYLANDVQISNGEVTGFNLADPSTSVNPTGFESLLISRETEDKNYYIIIRFVEGSMDSQLVLQLSHGSNYGFASGRVPASSAGRDLYYGPITKIGSNFVFR